MEPVKTIAFSLNDIVFENRNKQYGAYQIRLAYENHLSRATLIGVAMFAVALAFFWFKFQQEDIDKSSLTDGILNTTVLTETIFEVPPIEPPKVEPPKAKTTPPATEPQVPETQTQPIATERFTTMVVSDKTTEAPTRVDDLADRAIGTERTEGRPSTESDASAPTPKESTGEGTSTETDDVVNFADEMPHYEGGEKAIAKFIQNNLRVPSVVGEKEISGTVYVGFVVNSKGEVTDVKILKGIHPACDNEAMQVISKMNKTKKWVPGKQAGRNVSVRYTIPIKFDYQRM